MKLIKAVFFAVLLLVSCSKEETLLPKNDAPENNEPETSTVRDADSISLQVTIDNTIIQIPDESSPSLSNSLGHIFAGRTRQDSDGAIRSIRRALLQFDLSTTSLLETNSVIDSVILCLYFDRTSGASSSINLHQVLSKWTEGKSFFLGGQGAPSDTSDVSWYYSSYYNTKWNKPGGDYVLEPSATTEVGTDKEYGFKYWTSKKMTQNVRYWLNHPNENYGWMLIGDEEKAGGGTTKRFYSKDYFGNDSTNIPTLKIYFSIEKEE
ncbi:DNRLRE domain-containing protein [Saccharicrinis aurantiacus]|uniref:DNRLRE domain-containing protein n=1 Tax=Saccharicrinis aurantiacus TaxID=1849719 RepID=UPI0024905C77|nr:DNRLRE domain-containing protein [Saccharicrinis aurantiacus]